MAYSVKNVPVNHVIFFDFFKPLQTGSSADWNSIQFKSENPIGGELAATEKEADGAGIRLGFLAHLLEV